MFDFVILMIAKTKKEHPEYNFLPDYKEEMICDLTYCDDTSEEQPSEEVSMSKRSSCSSE